MDQNHFLPSVFIWIISVLICLIAVETCNAGNAKIYINENIQTGTETTLSIEIIADVGSESLGSFNLAISYYHKALQFISLSSGKTPGQPYPPTSNDNGNGMITVAGVFQNEPRGSVSLIIANFKCMKDCFKLPFNIFNYSLFGDDDEMPVEISGYQLTQDSIKRLTQDQSNGMPLIDLETASMITPLIGSYFDQLSAFISQISILIGEEKTAQYQSDILLYSTIAHSSTISVQCPDLFDMIKCLQFFSGMTSVTCNDITGDDKIKMNDIISGIQQIARMPE